MLVAGAQTEYEADLNKGGVAGGMQEGLHKASFKTTTVSVSWHCEFVLLVAVTVYISVDNWGTLVLPLLCISVVEVTFILGLQEKVYVGLLVGGGQVTVYVPTW